MDWWGDRKQTGDDGFVVAKVIDDDENDEWNVTKKAPVLYYSKRQSSSPSTMRFSIKPWTVQIQKSRTSPLRVHDAMTQDHKPNMALSTERCAVVDPWNSNGKVYCTNNN